MEIKAKYNIGDVVRYKDRDDIYIGEIGSIVIREEEDGLKLFYLFRSGFGVFGSMCVEDDIISRLVEED